MDWETKEDTSHDETDLPNNEIPGLKKNPNDETPHLRENANNETPGLGENTKDNKSDDYSQ